MFLSSGQPAVGERPQKRRGGDRRSPGDGQGPWPRRRPRTPPHAHSEGRPCTCVPAPSDGANSMDFRILRRARQGGYLLLIPLVTVLLISVSITTSRSPGMEDLTTLTTSLAALSSDNVSRITIQLAVGQQKFLARHVNHSIWNHTRSAQSIILKLNADITLMQVECICKA